MSKQWERTLCERLSACLIFDQKTTPRNCNCMPVDFKNGGLEVAGFGCDDVARLKRLKFIWKPNVKEISESIAIVYMEFISSKTNGHHNGFLFLISILTYNVFIVILHRPTIFHRNRSLCGGVIMSCQIFKVTARTD